MGSSSSSSSRWLTGPVGLDLARKLMKSGLCTDRLCSFGMDWFLHRILLPLSSCMPFISKCAEAWASFRFFFRSRGCTITGRLRPRPESASSIVLRPIRARQLALPRCLGWQAPDQRITSARRRSARWWKVTAALPLPIGISGVNNACKLLAGEIVRRNLLNP